MKRKIRFYIVTAFFGILATLGGFETATAEEKTEGDYILEETLVTAEKRVTNIQQTPISMTALNMENLDGRNIYNSDSLQYSVPGLTTSYGTGSFAALNIRGISNENLTAGGDPGVAVHYDGIYLGRPGESTLVLYDMAQVEVLRGPQGTLYGRNTTGGSINYVTQKPTDEFSALGDVTIGSYDLIRTRGAFNAPIVKDKLQLRFAFLTDDRDGIGENPWLDTKTGDLDDSNVRGTLRFLVTPDVEILLSGTRRELSTVPVSSKFLEEDIPNLNPAFAAALPFPSDPWTANNNVRNYRQEEYETSYGKVTWDAGDILLSSLTSYHENDFDYLIDWDYTELDLANVRRFGPTEQWSQEFQLTSDSEGALEWIAGLYFYSEETHDNAEVTGDLYVSPGKMLTAGMVSETDSYAGYGQTTYAVSDKFRITAGIRYTEDKKEAVEHLFFPAPYIHPTIDIAVDLDHEDEWREVTWKVGGDYQLTPENFLYASGSKGYKSGGFTLGQLTAQSYDPEYIMAYEIGSKNRFLENRLQANLSAFYYDYQDLQVWNWQPGTPLAIIDNAAEATIYGSELEIVALPASGMAIIAGVSYTHSEYDEYDTQDSRRRALGLLDLSGNELARTPQWTANIGVQYTFDMGNAGFLTPRIDYYWQDDSWFNQFQIPGDELESFGKTDIRLIYDSPQGKWYAELFATHLEDDEVIVTKWDRQPQIGNNVRQVGYLNPRMVGFKVGVRL